MKIASPFQNETDYAQSVLKTAQQEAKRWSDSSIRDRHTLMRLFKKTLKNAMDEWVECLHTFERETLTDAVASELMTTLSALRFLIENGGTLLKPRKEKTPLLFRGERAKVLHRPYGVVLIFSPWNFPMQLSLIPAFSALFAGNSVVLKPSEHLSKAFIEQLKGFVTQTLHTLGISQHLFQIIEGGPTMGKALIQAKPDKIFFTGGSHTGQVVYQQAAQFMIPCALELGGKDAMIVCRDANLKRAAKAAVWGAFFNGGQACISIERLVVHQSISESFIELVKTELSLLESGRDVPRPLHPQARVQVMAHVKEALDLGAQLVSGNLELENGLPILLTNVDSSMKVVLEETFGPVLTIQTFETDEEAIKQVNESDYGLNAAIFSSNLSRAEQIAKKLEVGNCVINNVLTNASNMNLPFGGRKKSGFGVTHGKEGLYEFTRPFSLTANKGKSSRSINWFPYKEDSLKYLKAFIKHLI